MSGVLSLEAPSITIHSNSGAFCWTASDRPVIFRPAALLRTTVTMERSINKS